MTQRISISVSDELYGRLQNFKADINVSKLCQEAIKKEIKKKEDFQIRITAKPELNEIIKRLRREKMESDIKISELGRIDGIEWAKIAHYEDLMLALKGYNPDDVEYDEVEEVDLSRLKKEGPLGIQIRRYLEKKVDFDADAIAKEEMKLGLMKDYEPELISGTINYFKGKIPELNIPLEREDEIEVKYYDSFYMGVREFWYEINNKMEDNMKELTRENCGLFLAVFMDENDLDCHDIAKATSCPQRVVERILAGITQPRDNMLKEVGIMLEIGFKRYSNLSKSEKKSVFEKLGAVSGGALGFSGISTAVGALGLPGLSAAGVTSGLGALGALLGGTMLTGIGVAAAIPIASGALGYGIIKAAKKIIKKMNSEENDFDPEWEVYFENDRPDNIDFILEDASNEISDVEKIQEKSMDNQSTKSEVKIIMGNDEFILYIRKNFTECITSTASLARSIWIWLKKNDPTAKKVEKGRPCIWGGEGKFVSADQLPKSATQFKFNVNLLPALYEYLNELGDTQNVEV